MSDFIMDTAGRHIIAEIWDIDGDVINDANKIEKIFVDAALAMGAEIREVAFHQFAPQGVSGVVIISESHLTVHTFPEHSYMSVDVYTCGTLDPNVAIQYIIDHSGAKSSHSYELPRGLETAKK